MPTVQPPETLMPSSRAPWRLALYRVIFGTTTPAGKWFDVVLLWMILLSILVVMLESVRSIRVEHESLLIGIEWFFTIVFTLEVLLRLLCVPSIPRYLFSFFGLIDILAILPTYLNLFFAGAHYLMVVRVFRLIRVFRVLKLIRFVKEGDILLTALKASRHKIIVFIGTVLTLVVLTGTLMYLIEGEENGFTSIPRGVYWAIVTLSTVGYGDIAPKTTLGQILACWVMIMGYGIIAVPTGIVSVEIHQATQKNPKPKAFTCGHCGGAGHDEDANFCKYCGESIR